MSRFYLTPSRSWSTSGIAMRYASTLGLNLRNDSKDVSEASKEIRYRVFWALCSLERMLAIMTGRPTSFLESDCTAPAPLPLEEDSLEGNNAPSAEDIALLRRFSSQGSQQMDDSISTPSSTCFGSKPKACPADSTVQVLLPSSPKWKQGAPTTNALFFGYHTKLSKFTDEVLNCLYRAGTVSKSWADVQTSIATLNSKIEKWRGELPNVFDFTKKQRDQKFVRQRMSLGFLYYSILTVINRPCLCRINRRVPDQSSKAKEFNRKTAMRCVHAARDMLEMLPQEPNPVGLYTVAPWWCLAHYLMQAATVLMLELSLGSDHMPNEAEEIFNSAIKATDWLRNLSEDEAARRAGSLCDEMLRKVAPKVGGNSAEASRYPGVSDQQGHSEDQMQGIDTTRFTQEPATSNVYLPQYGYSSSAQFHQPTFSAYDQFLSYGQLPIISDPELYNGVFPHATDLDAMHCEHHEPAGYFTEQHY